MPQAAERLWHRHWLLRVNNKALGLTDTILTERCNEENTVGCYRTLAHPEF
jgi:hypothetical protein